MALQLRHYRDEEDYWRARAFLRRLPRPDGTPGGNWHVALVRLLALALA